MAARKIDSPQPQLDLLIHLNRLLTEADAVRHYRDALLAEAREVARLSKPAVTKGATDERP